MYNRKICIKLSSGSFKQYLTISLAKLLKIINIKLVKHI